MKRIHGIGIVSLAMLALSLAGCADGFVGYGVTDDMDDGPALDYDSGYYEPDGIDYGWWGGGEYFGGPPVYGYGGYGYRGDGDRWHHDDGGRWHGGDGGHGGDWGHGGRPYRAAPPSRAMPSIPTAPRGGGWRGGGSHGGGGPHGGPHR